MDRMELEFHADTDGTFPMTWGQQDFWRKKVRAYGDTSRHFNLRMFVDLPDRTTVDEAVAAVRRLVERNEVLRTHLLDGPEGLRQRVARTGTIGLLLRQVSREESRPCAETLAAELAAAPFDHEAEWGIRFGLVSVGPTARYLTFAVSHAVADGGGILALLNDFFALLGAQCGGSEPDRPWQPADQADREQSPRGIRRNQAAIRYWRKALERMPPSMFPWPALPPQQPRFQRLRLDSRALGVAAARLAVNCQASVPSVVLAATALALSALSGQPACALMVVVSNRYDGDMRAMLGATSQDGLFVADFSGATVVEAVRAVHRSVTTTFFYGHYDPVAMEDLVRAVEAQRGVRLDTSAVYNDLSSFVEEDEKEEEETLEQAATLARHAEADVRDLLKETVITPESTWEGQHCKMYLAAERGRDRSSLALVADTAYLPTPMMEVLLRGIEKIVTEAAYRDIAVADIPALTGITRKAPGAALSRPGLRRP